MYPVLYKSDETNFVHNGLGLLTGTITAVATEELNGMFELNMQYDNEGFLGDAIEEEMIIKAKANDKQDEQLFRIYSITKNHENDNLIIDAVHITNDLANNFVEKLEVKNLTKRQVMELIGSSTAYPHPFNVTSSNSTTQSSTSLYRTNPLQMIAGMDGSVLQFWGGQIERDNFHLIMHDRRGSDDGTLVTYKKNLTGLTAKFDISNLVTRIFPYIFIEATDDEPEKLITVPGKYIDSPHINDYEMPYILPVDFSNEEGVETSQDLLNVASKWFVETGRDKPKVEMEVHFEHLWETEEYKDVAALELVGMGDTITVKHSKLKVEGAAIVNRIEYDVVADKNLAVDVGSVKARFTDKVNEVSGIVERVEQAEQTANQAIRAANGKNTNYHGPDEPIGNFNIGDLWFEEVDGEYTRTYRFDGIQWQPIVSADIKDIEDVANDARNKADQAVANANLATSNATEAIDQAQTAFDDAQAAITTAIDAEDLALTVQDLATALNTTVSGHATQITDIEGELSRKMTTVDANAKFATQSALQQTSSSLSSEIASVQGNLDSLEIGGRNLIPNSNDFTNLSTYNGSSYTYETNVTVDEWGATDATRIKTRGGAGDLKVLRTIAMAKSVNHTWSAWVKNMGENTFRIDMNGSSAPSVYIAPGESKRIIVKDIYRESYSFTQSRFRASNVNQDLDYIIWREKLEVGNVATDWTPAPEDIQSQFSSINQTVSEITTRVGNSEGDISSLQQTSSSFATRIGNAEGNISSLTQTAQGLQTAVSNKADKSTVTQLAGVVDTKITKGQADGWYASQSQLTQTASSLQSTITSVRNDLDGLEIGGRNLIPDSKELAWSAGTGNSSYQIVYRGLERNQTYTVSFDAELTGTGNTSFVTVYPYVRSGESMSTLHIPYKSGQRMKLTFTTDGRYDYNLLIYAGRSGSTAGNSIILRNLKLEKGNHATDWQPAPEDLATQSQFSQLSDNINLRVMKDDVINQINVSTESILISGKKLILDGDTTVTGTFRVDNANITSVNAGKLTAGTFDAGRVSVINLSANSITGGIQQSQNSNTTFNWNTGELNLVNNNITFGTGANINFESAGNTLTYRKYDSESGFSRSAGVGVGDRIGGRFPFAFLGTNGAANLDSLSQYFSGFIANSTAATGEDNAANSVNGFIFQMRNRAVGWDKGITYDFNGSPVIRPINGHLHDYDIGSSAYRFKRMYVDMIRGVSDFAIQNYFNERSGWYIQTNVVSSGSDITLRGMYGSEYNYQIGGNSTSNAIRNIYLRNNPVVVSDRRAKEDISSNLLGLSFIKSFDTKIFRLKQKPSEIERNKLQFGFIAQDLIESLNVHGVEINDHSMIGVGEDGLFNLKETQLIAPTIKAVQELDLKVDTEVSKLRKQNEELILKVAKLEERIHHLEVA